MTKTFITLIFAVSAALAVCAQDCSNYYFLTSNTEVEMTVYNAKGKESGKQTWKVTNVNKNDNDYRADIESVFIDDKGKGGPAGKGTFKCSNGVYQMDMKMAVPQQQMEAYKNMEVKADEVYIEYPGNMSPGQALADGIFKMEVYNNNALTSTIDFSQKNRKVDGKENITTPAGSWEAYKISYDGQFRASLAGIGIPMNFKAVEYFVPGYGLVKSETYSKNGKLMGSTVLTAVKK